MTCAPNLATTARRARARHVAFTARVTLYATLSATLCAAPLAAADPQPPPQAPTQPLLHVDFKDIPLQELVFLFSSLTGQNFILLAPNLASRTLTVYAPKPVTLAQATDLFITALRLHGLRVERRDPFWLIQPVTP